MPKNVSRRKTQNGAIIRTRPAPKFRIGNRKSGKAANLMSTDALKDVLNDVNKTKFHATARTVLTNRGVPLDFPEKLVA